MKYVLNFFGSLACLILGWCVAILLIALTMMNSTEFLVKENIVKNIIKDIDVAHLVGEESYEEITDSLEKSGIPKEYVSYVIEDENIKEYLGDYASEAVDFVLYEKDLPAIDAQELSDLLIKSFDTVVNEVNNNKIDIDKKLTDKDIKKVHSTIKNYVPKIIKNIPDAKELIGDETKDSQEYQSAREQIDKFTQGLELAKKAYSQRYILVILIIVGLGLTALIKWKSPKLLNWLWSPFVSALVVYLFLIFEFKTIMNHFFPSELEFLRTFINNNINRICDIWIRDAIIYTVIVACLVILKIVLNIRKNNHENKKFELEEPIYAENKEIDDSNDIDKES